MYTRITKYLHATQPEVKSILWMLLSCFLSSVMAAITKHVAMDMPPLQMVFLRNFSAVIFLLPWMLMRGIPHIKAAHFRLYFSRSISSVLAMSMFFYAIATIPLTDAIAMTFTVPLATTLLAAIFLGEKVGIHRWAVLLIGFSGVLIIMKPGQHGLNNTYFMLLFAALAWSVSNILIKKLTNTDHPRAMVFIMMLIMTPLTLPAALYVWQPFTIMQLIWLFILGAVTTEAQFCMNKAYKGAEMSLVMPFDFSRLIFTSMLAYMFFAEVIDIGTFIGSLIIFSSSMYIARREYHIRRKKKEQQQVLEV